MINKNFPTFNEFLDILVLNKIKKTSQYRESFRDIEKKISFDLPSHPEKVYSCSWKTIFSIHKVSPERFEEILIDEGITQRKVYKERREQLEEKYKKDFPLTLTKEYNTLSCWTNPTTTVSRKVKKVVSLADYKKALEGIIKNRSARADNLISYVELKLICALEEISTVRDFERKLDLINTKYNTNLKSKWINCVYDSLDESGTPRKAPFYKKMPPALLSKLLSESNITTLESYSKWRQGLKSHFINEYFVPLELDINFEFNSVDSRGFNTIVRDDNFATFEQLKELVKKYNITKYKDYLESKSKIEQNEGVSIPAKPERHYKGEFTSYRDLFQKIPVSLSELEKVCRELGITSSRDYKRRYEEICEGVQGYAPKNPDSSYKGTWTSWKDFLYR